MATTSVDPETPSIDIDSLPVIPKEWNLTDQQRASMIAEQKKNMALSRDKAVIQKTELGQFMKNAAMSPPVYPIAILVKKNDVLGKKNYYLKDTSNNFLYASSFEQATTIVKTQLANPNSPIQQLYASDNPGSKKLRMSSDNAKSSTKIGNCSLIPSSNYKFWQIITTNAAPSFFSNMRQSMQGGRKKTRRSRKTKRSRKTRRSRKTKRSKKSKRRVC